MLNKKLTFYLLVAISPNCKKVDSENIRKNIDIENSYHIILPDDLQRREFSTGAIIKTRIRTGLIFWDIITEEFNKRYPLSDYITQSALPTIRMADKSKILDIDFKTDRYKKQFMQYSSEYIETTIYITQFGVNPDRNANDAYLIEHRYECHSLHTSAWSTETMFKTSVYEALQKYFSKTCQSV